MIPRIAEGITWIRVEPPTLDVVGLILGSLGMAGTLAATALGLGIALGVTFILRSRSHAPVWTETVQLHLDFPNR